MPHRYRQPVTRASVGDQPPAAGCETKLGLFKKTRLCKFNQVGACTRGSGCTFAHDAKELQPQPDFFCTKLCRNLVTLGVCEDPECRFAHKKDQIRKNVNFKESGRNSSLQTISISKQKVVQETMRDRHIEENLSAAQAALPMNMSAGEAWPLVMGIRSLPRICRTSMMMQPGGPASGFDQLPVAEASWPTMTLEQACHSSVEGECWNLQSHGMSTAELRKNKDLNWIRKSTFEACDFNDTAWNLSRQSTADSDGWEEVYFCMDTGSQAEEAASDNQSLVGGVTDLDNISEMDSEEANMDFKSTVKDSFLEVQVQDFAETEIFHKNSGLSFKIKNTFIEICDVSELEFQGVLEGCHLTRSASCPNLGPG